MRRSRLLLGLIVAAFAVATVAQRRHPRPLAPSGFLLSKIAGIVGGESAFHHTVVLVREDEAASGGPIKDAMLITVGSTEGNAIAMGLSRRSFVRPLTHDLLSKILDRTGQEVRGVYIHSLQDQTFFARLELGRGGARTSFDCRPSDAIAIAVRHGAPVWIETKLFERAAVHLPPTPKRPAPRDEPL